LFKDKLSINAEITFVKLKLQAVSRTELEELQMVVLLATPRVATLEATATAAVIMTTRTAALRMTQLFIPARNRKAQQLMTTWQTLADCSYGRMIKRRLLMNYRA